MARPPRPLIQHDLVVKASLRIIDDEGLDAFSLPRLARELDVRAPSLYHHFQDKAEILRVVARAIVLETEMPDEEGTGSWIEWFVALSLAFREAVLRHRNAAPILLRFMPRDVLIRTFDNSARLLDLIGIPPQRRVLILDGMDRLTLGAAISEAARNPEESGQIFPNVDPETEPTLAAAMDANRLSAEELFAETIRCFLRGAAPEIAEDIPIPRRRPPRTVRTADRG